MQQDALQTLLTACAADRLAILLRHEAAARIVSQYDFNNAYQYVINRGETHLQWLGAALAEFGASLPAASTNVQQPEAPAGRKTPGPAMFSGILADDARILGEFVERWRPAVATMTHARHRTMLNVMLGELLEHQRLFAQGASGREDLLGRHAADATRVGAVLPARWME